MPKKTLVRILIFIAPLPLFASVVPCGIVGFTQDKISNGISSVSIEMFESIGLFPTLGEVCWFNPATETVGDTISFTLDGKFRSFKIISVDKGKMTLRENTENQAQNHDISLEDIPLLSSFNIRHERKTPITIHNSGLLSDTYGQKAGVLSNKPNILVKVSYTNSIDGEEKDLSRHP